MIGINLARNLYPNRIESILSIDQVQFDVDQ